MSLAQQEQARSDRARRRRAALVAEMAAATPEPEPYAVAPLGDGWTVVAPDAESIVAPTDWTLAEAVARRGLAEPRAVGAGRDALRAGGHLMVRCPTCQELFPQAEIEAHMRDAHGARS